MKAIGSIYLPTREQWREWLAANHETEPGIWLIFYKKHTGKPSLPYDHAVEEALCYGWIDSIIRRIDEERYRQKFTPRKMRSSWSVANVMRVEALVKQGKMTPKGLDLYQYAKEQNLLPDASLKQKPKMPDTPAWLKKALNDNPAAGDHFNKLAPSHRRHYLMWLMDAKREDTRTRRLQEAIDKLSKGEQLGMK
jgi:uncharacterized protein YdeI (YjbR/CyaY-like superfamily)